MQKPKNNFQENDWINFAKIPKKKTKKVSQGDPPQSCCLVNPLNVNCAVENYAAAWNEWIKMKLCNNKSIDVSGEKKRSSFNGKICKWQRGKKIKFFFSRCVQTINVKPLVSYLMLWGENSSWKPLFLPRKFEYISWRVFIENVLPYSKSRLICILCVMLQFNVNIFFLYEKSLGLFYLIENGFSFSLFGHLFLFLPLRLYKRKNCSMQKLQSKKFNIAVNPLKVNKNAYKCVSPAQIHSSQLCRLLRGESVPGDIFHNLCILFRQKKGINLQIQSKKRLQCHPKTSLSPLEVFENIKGWMSIEWNLRLSNTFSLAMRLRATPWGILGQNIEQVSHEEISNNSFVCKLLVKNISLQQKKVSFHFTVWW